MPPSEKRLLDMLLSECNLLELINCCEELLGQPLLYIFDTGSDGYIASDHFDLALSHLEQQKVHTFLAQHGKTLHSYLSDNTQFLPFTVETSFGGEETVRHLVCLSGAGHSVDGLVCIKEQNGSLEHVDRELLQLCARCLALCLHQRRWNHKPFQFRRAMQLLLTGRGGNYPAVAHEVGTGMLPSEGHYRLLTVRRLLPDTAIPFSTLIGQLSRLLHTEWIYGEDIISFLLLREEQMPKDAGSTIESLLALAGCSACLSPMYPSLRDTWQWRSRNSLLPAFLSAPAGRLVHYPDWMDWGMFTLLPMTPEELRNFLPKGFRRLQSMDEEEGTEYLATLEAYFAHQCSKKHAGDALGVHVNTVLLRLQKAEEITGISLHSPHAWYLYPMALRIIGYQKASRHENTPEL